jgi:cob(I)alamin adenosyltransferase
MARQGIVQVYTGEGKGKTSAAVGAVVRALGHGWRILLVRFLKPAVPESGEVTFLRHIDGVEILTSGIGVIDPAHDRDAVAQSVRSTFQVARGRIATGSFDLVVFDEINNVLHRGYLSLPEVLLLLDEKPQGLEVILTGRHAPAEITARADLVTRLEKDKHPRDQGLPARPGVEF